MNNAKIRLYRSVEKENLQKILIEKEVCKINRKTSHLLKFLQMKSSISTRTLRIFVYTMMLKDLKNRFIKTKAFFDFTFIGFNSLPTFNHLVIKNFELCSSV